MITFEEQYQLCQEALHSLYVGGEAEIAASLRNLAASMREFETVDVPSFNAMAVGMTTRLKNMLVVDREVQHIIAMIGYLLDPKCTRARTLRIGAGRKRGRRRVNDEEDVAREVSANVAARGRKMLSRDTVRMAPLQRRDKRPFAGKPSVNGMRSTGKRTTRWHSRRRLSRANNAASAVNELAFNSLI
jgi:hypothetical protein